MGAAPLSQYPHMKVIRLILDQSPPTLPENGGWSPEFRAFVNCCLKKDPKERPDIETLLVQHSEFLAKARDKDYIQQNFLASLPPLEERLKPELAANGEEFLERLAAAKRPKKQKKKFDFGSGGDQRNDAAAASVPKPKRAAQQ